MTNDDHITGFKPPRKRLGQHFLTDRNIIRKIISASGACGYDTVLEIGPGRGALTEALLDAGSRVVAIEADRELAFALENRFKGAGRLTVITGDALKASFIDLSEKYGARLKAVSNLPYNISGPIIAKFIEERRAFTSLTLMFQKEVAGRITASPGGKDYGALSVLAQAYLDVKKAFDVPATVFFPKPKVASSVVSCRVLDEPRVKVYDEAFFRATVRSAFSLRRKMLSNALKSTGLERGSIETALDSAGIDPKRRAETLSLEEFSRLAGALFAVKTSG